MKQNIFSRYIILFLLSISLFNAVNIFAERRDAAAPAPAAYAASGIDEDAPGIISDIIKVVGLKPNFEVMSADVPNALATTYRGKRYIAYNPQFISRLNQAAGNKWAAVSVLAHEIGHHLNGHTLLNTGSQPKLELEADEFSGFVLRKMGATLEQAQSAMKVAATYKPSLTHPGQADRLVAIQKGWNNAGANPGDDMAKYSKPEIPQRSTEPVLAKQSDEKRGITNTVASDEEAVLDSKYVLAKVSFNNDKATNYYVTVRYNVVKVENGQLQVLGKMLATDSNDYPYVLKGNHKGLFFIDRQGRIFTQSRELAGYLRA